MERREAVPTAAQTLKHSKAQKISWQEHLGVAPKEVYEAQCAAVTARATSLSALLELTDALTVADVIGSEDPNLELIPDLQILRAALARLNERDRLIIELRFFHELSQEQIGKKFRVTQPQVSRLLRQILNELGNGFQ